MANSESPSGLQAKDFTDQRNDALREGVKGLFVMNGGGAVAMLAFLQAIWKDNPQLAKYVIASIALLAAGVFLAGLVQIFRYNASSSFQGGRSEEHTSELQSRGHLVCRLLLEKKN